MGEGLDAALAGLAATPLAQAMRLSRWGYAAASTGHVLGISLLVGAILPLDLRLLGLWRGTALAALAGVLVPVAALGLALAVTTGALLFLAAPFDYVGAALFLAKMALVATGTSSALALHLAAWRTNPAPGSGGVGARIAALPARRQALAGALSLGCWLGALIAGRMLAFTAD